MAQNMVAKMLVESLIQAFEKQEDCDVNFCVEGKLIGAHRMTLKSPCQFLYDLSCNWTPENDPIGIEDISYDAFIALLRYMYSGVHISDDNAFSFLSASIKFKMEYLEELCAEHIIKSIGTDNVCTFMEEAINFKSVAIQEKCLDLFSKQTAEIVKMDLFKNISQPALSAFLDVEESNDLEIGIFLSVKQWMEQKCKQKGLVANGENMRKVIGDALYKIRFPTMTNQDFANSVSTIKGLLTDKEMLQVFQKISVFDSQDIDCTFSSIFRCKICKYYVPFGDMLRLCDALLYDNVRKQECNLETLLQNVKDTADDEPLNMTLLRIVMQCCADLANSEWIISRAQSYNQDIRNELCSDFKNWKEMGKTKNVHDVMTKYVGMRAKLAKLCRWSLL